MSNIINKTPMWASTFPTTIPLLQKLKKCWANCKATPLTLPWPILLNIYNSLIHPYLTYGLAAWGQACKTYLNKILILHKRDLRLPYFADWHDHAIPLFLKVNVLPTTFPYYESVSTLMHDINDNKAPANVSNLFHLFHIHSYNTRSSTSGKFYVKSTRLEIVNNSFSRLGIKLWNKIPSYHNES